MENKIILHIPELEALTAEIGRLANALSAPTAAPSAAPSAPPVSPAAGTGAAPVTPLVPSVTAAPIPAAPLPATVPTAAPPAYTLEQLSLAGRQLADAGRMPEVQQLVAQFGAQTLMQIPPERYGEFATALRGLGARI